MRDYKHINTLRAYNRRVRVSDFSFIGAFTYTVRKIGLVSFIKELATFIFAIACTATAAMLPIIIGWYLG